MSIDITEKEDFIYDKIKSILDAKGLSLRDLGEHIGMSVNGIYTGFNRKSLKVDTLLKIMLVLDIEPRVLFEREDEKERQVVLLKRKLQESEELLIFLRDKQSEFMTNYEMQLLERAKKQITTLHETLKKTPNKKLLTFIKTYEDLSKSINEASELSYSIIRISPEKESIKSEFKKYHDDIRLRLAETEAVVLMKELNKM